MQLPVREGRIAFGSLTFSVAAIAASHEFSNAITATLRVRRTGGRKKDLRRNLTHWHLRVGARIVMEGRRLYYIVKNFFDLIDNVDSVDNVNW